MSFKSTPAAGAELSVKINGNFVAIGGLEGLPEFGPERAWIETTHINDTAKSYVPDMADSGEQTLVGDWDSKDAGQVELLAGAEDTLATEREFQADFNSGASAAFKAVIGSFRVSANKGQAEKFSCKLRLNGKVNYTPAS